MPELVNRVSASDNLKPVKLFSACTWPNRAHSGKSWDGLNSASCVHTPPLWAKFRLVTTDSCMRGKREQTSSRKNASSCFQSREFTSSKCHYLPCVFHSFHLQKIWGEKRYLSGLSGFILTLYNGYWGISAFD